MADVLKGARTYLLSKSAVSGLLGNRVYYHALPQDPTYPAATLEVITTRPIYHLTNASGLERATIQVDCYGKTHDSVYNLADAIRRVTQHYTGAWGGVTVKNSLVESMRDLTEPPNDGSQLFRHIRSIDLVVWYTTTLPST